MMRTEPFTNKKDRAMSIIELPSVTKRESFIDPATIDEHFETIVKENRLTARLHDPEISPSDVTKLIDQAPRKLDAIVSIQTDYGEALSDENASTLRELIREDALVLIATRTTDLYKNRSVADEVFSHNIDPSMIGAVSPSREDAISLVKAYKATHDELIRSGAELLIEDLPAQIANPLHDTLTDTNDFDTAYKDATKKRHLGLIGLIETTGQRLTLSPEEINTAVKRGSLTTYVASKERNLIRRTGSERTVLGDATTSLKNKLKRRR